MSLESEIESASRQVSTDSFSITIGEISNMYQDNDVRIDPEFQRLFRWDISRKSRLIESILVRIPLPPIFVFEQPDSKWEVIDGLQRLSTVLEFMGELKNPNGELSEPEALIGTQYLPSLNGAFWAQKLLDAQRERDIQRKNQKDPTYFDNTSACDVNFSRFLMAVKAEPDRVFKKGNFEKINGNSNLNSEVLGFCCGAIGIEIGAFEQYFSFIDDLLISRRNHIAHGEALRFDPGEVSLYRDNVVELMRICQTQFKNAVHLKTYRRAA